jgi:hypothetical protein
MALFLNESFCACKCLQCDSILFQVMSQANFLPKVLSFIDIRLCLKGHLHWQSLRFCVFWVRKLASPTRAVLQQIGLFMDKLQRTGQNMGQVFNSIIDRLYALLLCCGKAKQTILKLKARPKQLLGNVPSKCCLSVCFCSLLYCPRKQSKS